MSTSSAGSQQEGAPGGHPYLLPPASMPAHHEQQAHVKAVRPAPQGRCHMPTTCMHHALKFCITKQAKGEGGCSYHLCMPSLWVRDSGLAKPAQVLLSAGISASLGVLPACRG